MEQLVIEPKSWLFRIAAYNLKLILSTTVTAGGLSSTTSLLLINHPMMRYVIEIRYFGNQKFYLKSTFDLSGIQIQQYPTTA